MVRVLLVLVLEPCLHIDVCSGAIKHALGYFILVPQCLTKAGGRDHEALAAFDNALKHESNPPAPVFKGLSELHDRMGNYEESGDSLKRQYEVLKSKGNFAKAVEVGKSVVDRWQKTTKQQNTLKQINKNHEQCHGHS